MKTVVIIVKEDPERKALTNLFEKWHRKLNVLNAVDKVAAAEIMAQNHVDLVICELSIQTRDRFDNFSTLTHAFPYIPCIVISPNADRVSQESSKQGVNHWLTKPIDPALLLRLADELLNIGTSGTIRGIPCHSFLQMLDSEKKTCTLSIKRKNDTGLMYMKDGALIGAETKELSGEEAAHLILTWQEPVIEVRYFNGQRSKQINRPLLSVIIEAFHLKNKKDKQLRKNLLTGEHQLRLKHVPTVGKRIPLEIGARVKLEFPHLDFPLESILVGMLKDQYLIISNPKPSPELDKLTDTDQRIIIKYIQKGRVWMFKAQLLKILNAPYLLLFFDYPQVIHYHEMRQAVRTPIFIPCTFHQQSKPEYYGILRDMNITGSLCQIKRTADIPLPSVKTGSQVKLRCLLPGIKEEQEIAGTVRNSRVTKNEAQIGIEFHNLQPHLTEAISRYLYSIEEVTD